MASYGDTSTKIDVYTKWEREDSHGTKLNTAQRKKAFEEWCVRMLVRHMAWEETPAKTWVAEVISPHDVTSCHEFEGGWNPSTADRSKWKRVVAGTESALKVADAGAMNILFKLVEGEIQAIGATSSRPADQMSMSSMLEPK